MFDSSPAFMHGLCFGFPCRSGGPVRPRKPGEVSRFSRVQFLDVLMALGLRRICRELALAFPSVLPSRWKHAVGIRFALFEARFPARRCLCLHFTRNLTAPSARLEVKMVRYSFLVGLFPPRLHAGLSRRLHSLAVVAQNGAARVSCGQYATFYRAATEGSGCRYFFTDALASGSGYQVYGVIFFRTSRCQAADRGTPGAA
jgi:hypothetical protein